MHFISSSFALALTTVIVSAVPFSDERSSSLVARAVGNEGTTYADYFPDCANDPSYATGKSQYTDGSGYYVTSSCNNGLYALSGKYHCWTDLFVVTSQASYTNWANTGNAIDCKTTSTCYEYKTSLNQSCTVDTTTWDNKFGGSIEAQFPLWFGKDNNIAPSLSLDHNWGGAKAVQICTTTGNTGTCSWTDQNCHAIWAAQRNIQVNGYVRRSCNTPRSGTNMPNSKKRPDGYYTVGMQDLSFAVPDNYLIGCAATCADLTYPNPSPGPENVTPIANPDGSLPDPNVITPPSN